MKPELWPPSMPSSTFTHSQINQAERVLAEGPVGEIPGEVRRRHDKIPIGDKVEP